MLPIPRLLLIAAFAAIVTLAGCATQQPHPYAGLPSSTSLQPNPDDTTGHVPYRMASQATFRAYSRATLDDVSVYTGADNQFDDGMTDDDKRQLAVYMRKAFAQALGKRFQLGAEPAPGTLRISLTITGAKANTAVLSTFTRFDLAGGPYNIVQGIRGKEGAFTGSVMYAVEIRDAATGRLLDAFVSKQYPNAMNVAATVGRLSAAETGMDKGADELVAYLERS